MKCSRSRLPHSLEPLYSITVISVCQELFSSFFKLFRPIQISYAALATASIYYHIPNHLSTPKTNFFEIVFKFYFRQIQISGRLIKAAVIHYNITKMIKEKPHSFECGLCWHYLSSRAVARQVLSAQMSLTSVFGMGTGGPSSQSIRTLLWKRSSPSYFKLLHGFLLFAASSQLF